MRTAAAVRLAVLQRVRSTVADRRRAPLAAPPSDLPGTGPEGPDLAEPAATPTSRLQPEAVPPGLQIAASWAWRVLLLAVLVLALAYALHYLSEVTIPLAIATLLAALLTPVARRLHLWGVPQAVAALTSVLGGLLLIAGALTLIGTQIAGQAADLSKSVVTGFTTIVDYLERSRLPISREWFQADKWSDTLSGLLTSSQSTITSYVAQISAQVGHFLAGFAITLFALFYFLYQGRAIWRSLLSFFPRTARLRVDAAARKGWTSLSHYVRATILVAFSDAVGVLVVALLIGVPLAPALAALVFIGAFVPLIGAFVSGFVAVIVALVALGWVKALFMLAGIILVMQIEGHLLQPFLLGRAVKLHPLAVLLGIAIGLILGGVVGALLSIPILAFSKSFIQDLARMQDDGPRPKRSRPEPLEA
ncbi:MAG TPA: AI-2E family transporter [Propionibacteriaceae bacterium]|jgi:predicted PurR-regulated permease PerM